MDTGERKRAIIVGIFLTLALIIFVFGIFAIGNIQKSFVSGVQIKSVFDDVSGLKKGNNVVFSGVKIGTISTVKFLGIAQVEVTMKIEDDSKPFIHANATTRIGTDGLIGNKTVVIDGGTPDAPAIQNGDVLKSQKLLSTDDMMKTFQANNLNFEAITGDFKKISRMIAEGKGTVGTLIADSTMAIKFRSIVQNLQTTTETTNRMAAALYQFGNKLNSKGTLADKLLTDTSTYRQLQTSINNLHQVSIAAGTLMNNLNMASDKLNGSNSAAGVLLNDPKVAAQIRSMLTNLHQSSIKLNDDLEAAQHNFLLKGFFKSREKAKADSLKK